MLFPRAATALALTLAAASASAAPFSLNFLGSYSVPKGTTFNGAPFGGISGLVNDGRGGFTALSDHRGGGGHSPRFYNLSLNYDLNGFHGVTINSQTTIKDASGTPLPADRPTVDPEAIRRAPGGGYYISSEGNFSSDPAKLAQPKVFKVGADGRINGEIATPSGYDYVDNATTGARNNKLFEAMAVGKNGSVYVGTEEALIQDGPASSATEGSVVRIAKLDPNGAPQAQYAYELPKTPLNGLAGRPGLVEMLATEDGGFLTMERSWTVAAGNTISLNYARIDGATDVLGTSALTGGAYTPMSREQLLLMKDDFMGVDLDNMEAMAFGKRLKNGNLSLILASDDNFNPKYQRSLFMAFEIKPTAAPVPLPAGLPLLAAALGALGLLRRRG